MNMASKRGRLLFVYDIPYSVRKGFCDLLDASGEWKNFAAQLPCVTPNEVAMLSTLQLGGQVSPTDKLLTKWGFRNATIPMLIKVLEELNLRQAVQLLQPVMTPKEKQQSKAADRARDNPACQRKYEETLSSNSYNCASERKLQGESRVDLGRYNSQGTYQYQRAVTNLCCESEEAELPGPEVVEKKRTESEYSDDSSNCNVSMVSIHLDSMEDCSESPPPPPLDRPPQAGGGGGYHSGYNGQSPKKRPVEYPPCQDSKTNLRKSVEDSYKLKHHDAGLKYHQTTGDYNHKNPKQPASLPEYESVRENAFVVNISQPQSRELKAPPPGSSNSSVSLQPMSEITQEFTYNEMERATNKWHDSYLIGEGGFGTVYKGIIRRSVMAIKVFNKGTICNGQGVVAGAGSNVEQHFKADIRALERYRSDNILPLYGYSCDGPHWCLIFQFMANGSLEDRLQCKNSTPPLQWTLRHRILQDAARGLQYLHESTPPLIHGDIKSANILLDNNWVAKISDFGLARQYLKPEGATYTIVTATSYDDKFYGTQAYLPDTFCQGASKYHKEMDTFSFGVVIFETCTGEKPTNPNRHNNMFLKDYVRSMVDKEGDQQILNLKDKKASNWPDEVWRCLLDLGRKCIAQRRKDRPRMNELLVDLEKLECLVQVKKVVIKKSFSVPPINIAPEGASATSPVLVTYSRQDQIPNENCSGSYSPESKLPTPPADYSRLKQMTDDLAKSMGTVHLGSSVSSGMSDFDPDDRRFFEYDKSKLPELEDSSDVVSDCLPADMPSTTQGVAPTDVSKISADDPKWFVYDERKLADPAHCSMDDKVLRISSQNSSLPVSSAYAPQQTHSHQSVHPNTPGTPDLYTAGEAPQFYQYEQSKLGEVVSGVHSGSSSADSRLEDISLPYRLQKEYDEAKFRKHSVPKENAEATLHTGMPYPSHKESFYDSKPSVPVENTEEEPCEMPYPSQEADFYKSKQSILKENEEEECSGMPYPACQVDLHYSKQSGFNNPEINVDRCNSHDERSDKEHQAESIPGVIPPVEEEDCIGEEQDVGEEKACITDKITSLDEAQIIAAKSKKSMFAFLDSPDVLSSPEEVDTVKKYDDISEQNLRDSKQGYTSFPVPDSAALPNPTREEDYASIHYQPDSYVGEGEAVSYTTLYGVGSSGSYNSQYTPASTGTSLPYSMIPVANLPKGAVPVSLSAFGHLSHVCQQTDMGESSLDSGQTIIAGSPLTGSPNTTTEAGCSTNVIYRQIDTRRLVYRQPAYQSSAENLDNIVEPNEDPSCVQTEGSFTDQQAAALSSNFNTQIDPLVGAGEVPEVLTSAEEDESRIQLAMELQQRKVRLTSLTKDQPGVSRENDRNQNVTEAPELEVDLKYFRPGRRKPVEV